MTDMETKDAAAETVVGVAAGAVGLGTLMLALFPFAIPILALTAVFVAPLALLGLIPLALAGIVAAIVLAGRTAWRRLRSRTTRHPVTSRIAISSKG